MAVDRNTGPTGGASGDGPAHETPTDRRLRRQTERIRELERLMRAAAAFARGRPER